MAIWGIDDHGEDGGLTMVSEAPTSVRREPLPRRDPSRLLVLGVWLTNAVFTQKFISFDRCPRDRHHGLQLPERRRQGSRGHRRPGARRRRPNGEGAELDARHQARPADSIPANVTAPILPKTLFGEKYVALNIPTDPRLAAASRPAT